MKIYCKLSIASLVIAGSIIGTLLFLNLSLFLNSGEFLEQLTGTRGVLVHTDNSFSEKDGKALALLVKGGHVLTHTELLDVLTNFYNGIINILVVVISLLGVLVYLSLSNLSRRHAEEIAQKSVENEFRIKLSDRDFVDSLLSSNEALSGFMADIRGLLREISPLQNKITGDNGLERRIENIELFLMSLEPKDESLKASPKEAPSKVTLPHKPAHQRNRNGRNKKK